MYNEMLVAKLFTKQLFQEQKNSSYENTTEVPERYVQ